MNNIIELLKQQRASAALALEFFDRQIALVESKAIPDLSDTATVNGYGGSLWVSVDNREDLGRALQLAPRWTKSPSSDGIDYNATSETGIDCRIQAKDAALPPTCKLVEKEFIVPAQPEYIEKRMILECAQPL